ncbi:hypothetical protein WAF17_01830 [Bernardetia sp. ABR2-2B]|uniref:hypothetical protein n=1 Tax=Bernardetia sp. ABR2-2B TaxID=3127472 RepID=UPI0030D4A4FB
MLSKNFIFTALFFGVILFCISCLGNQNKDIKKYSYTTLPTDSSNFTTTLDNIEAIKNSNFDLDGKWQLKIDSLEDSQYLYLIFEGRKVYSNMNTNYSKKEGDLKEEQVFAIYNKCPDEAGVYDKKGNFLVIGSGNEKLVCYEVVSYESTKIILYDVAKGGKLEFTKVD